MNIKEPVCFVSYCHKHVDMDVIEYLVFIIKSMLSGKVQVLYDSDLRPGESINKFMNRTLEVDVAIVLMSPQYKIKVDNQIGGVYEEYKKITNRFWGQQESFSDNDLNSMQDRFDLIPVVISGSIEESVPVNLRDLLCVDLAGFSVIKNQQNQFVVTEHIKKRYSREIQKIIDALIATAQTKSEAFKEKRKSLYDALFVNTKTTEQIIIECTDFFTEVFVPTAAFDYVQKQHRYFLIGRKGSGKSTLATALIFRKKTRYNDAIQIRAEEINLNSAYSLLRSETKSDIQQFLTPLSFFDYSWRGFLSLCIVELLEKLNIEDGKITDIQKKYISPILQYLENFRQMHSKSNLKCAFFEYATQRLQEYLDECIKMARGNQGESGFHADIHVAFNNREYIEFLLGKEVLTSLEAIVINCKKKVLVTLDDFDTIFDTFRRSALPDEDAKNRARFETDWLRSFLLLILEVKDTKYGDDSLFRTLDFCITIPKDRFLEIERSERDGYRYDPRTCTIDWSGIELCEVLFRRLKKFYNYIEKSPSKVDESLRRLLREEFPVLPDNVEFEFNGKIIKIPLFCYVLRHTFWRPRDVLKYYADILAAVFSVEKSGYKITSSIIRHIISVATYSIIKTEFLAEYESTISNLRQIVNSFMECSQVLTYSDVQIRIGAIPFMFLSADDPNINMIEKIEFLYDIGFLGIVMDQKIQALLNFGMTEAFYFNEGRAPMRAARKRNFRDVKFVIHPIFSENLQLDPSGNNFLLNITWDYLYENHTIKTTAHV